MGIGIKDLGLVLGIWIKDWGLGLRIGIVLYWGLGLGIWDGWIGDRDFGVATIVQVTLVQGNVVLGTFVQGDFYPRRL